MADQKISELTAITGANTADDDLLVIVDTSASQTKKITLGELENALAERDFNFGDNDKAIFGAGSDLQIYHDGNNSFIDENGVGNLFIRSVNGASTRIYSGGTASSNLRLLANSGGEITLYHSGSAKLATTSTGIDVTGTVTADGLTVDGTDTEAATSQLLKVRNSTTGEAVTIGLYAKADNGGDGNAGSITFDAGADGSASNNTLRFSADHQTDTNPALSIAGNGDISFYEDTGTTAKFFWDASAEALGIGTTSPALQSAGQGLHIDGATYSEIKFTNTTTGSTATDGTALVAASSNFTINNREAGNLQFNTSNTERMRIDSSGNVLVGTTDIAPATNNVAGISLRSEGHVNISRDGGTVAYINRKTSDGTLVDFRRDGTTVGSIASVGGSDIKVVLSSDGDQYITGNAASNYMTFSAANAERMRLDASGNLLVGKTSSAINTDGVELLNSGRMFLTTTSLSHAIRRKSTDGALVEFQKDTTTVGSIGSVGGNNLTVGTGDTGLRFQSGSDSLIPHDISTNSTRDAAINIGTTGARFKDLYLSGGVYLGGTGAANKLDDYEEGTWTPSFGGINSNPVITYFAREGEYVKIGNMCHARFYLRVTTVTTDGSGILYINLPFSINDTGYNGWTGHVGWNNQGTGWSNAPYNLAAINNTNRAYFHKLDMSTGAINDLLAGDVNDGALVEGHITFKTT